MSTKTDLFNQFGLAPGPVVNGAHTFQGGTYCKFSFSLHSLWDWHQYDWNIWSLPTDGYNLCRYKYGTLKFMRHRSINLIVVIEQDYCQNEARGWPFYHPQKMLLHRGHRIILSKNRSCGNKNYVKIRIRPKATETTTWYLMAQMAMKVQFTVFVSAIEIESPFMNPSWPSGVITRNIKWGNWQTTETKQWSYAMPWDKGVNNGFWIAQSDDVHIPPQNITFADALGKHVPYYISLFGKTATELKRTFIWIPDKDISQSTQRKWGALDINYLTDIIRSGPYVLKGLTEGFSASVTYKLNFQFGGPDVTDGYIAGTNPIYVPPGCDPHADTLSGRLETRNIAERADATANPWEWRRGYLTTQALQRLTNPYVSTELLGRFEQEDSEQEQSEEDSNYEEEEKSKEKERGHIYKY